MMTIGRDGLGARRKARAGRGPRGRAGALMASILLCGALALPALPVHADATDALFEAAESGTASEVKAALAAGADVGARDKYTNTPLHIAAAYNSNPAAIEVLIAAGADPGARDEFYATPLHGAGRSKSNPSVIEALIEADADVGAHDEFGMTPFDYAKRNNEALKGTDATGC